MAVVKVKNRELSRQLERKGFIYSGHTGNGINRPFEFCLAGDPRKLSKREMPYVHVVGILQPPKGGPQKCRLKK